MSDDFTSVDRRNFFKRTTMMAGAATMAVVPQVASMNEACGSESSGTVQARSRNQRLPREVWIATISQHGMQAKTPHSMVRQVLERMKEVVSFEPDIVCLPETFPLANLVGSRVTQADVAEEPIGELSAPFAEFARKHHCYVVCPIVTKQDGRIYNSAVLIDRMGSVVGEYHKVHPTEGELRAGITPGELDPPVFRTDFGIVGAQICFDIEWTESWRKLRQSGAEIVFWPSAFAGGQMVNTKAWENKYCVVSSTHKDTSKICDISGETIAKTGRWNRWACAPVNLEKAFLHTWPFVRRFDEIHAKYGRDIVIRNFAEEEWTIIESRSPDVKVADVLKEFELQTHEEHIAAADQLQRSRRPD